MDGGRPVEHPAQCPLKKLSETKAKMRSRITEVVDGDEREVTPSGERLGKIAEETGQVDERGARGDVTQVLDGESEQCLLDGGEIPAKHDTEQTDHQGLAVEERQGRVTGAGVERVHPVVAARRETNDGKPEGGADCTVLAFGVGDGDEPSASVVAGLSPQDRLGGGRLAEAGLADDEHVGVGQGGAAKVSAVELERIEEPAGPTGGDVDAEERAALARHVSSVERVDRRDVRCRAAVPADPEPGPEHRGDRR